MSAHDCPVNLPRFKKATGNSPLRLLLLLLLVLFPLLSSSIAPASELRQPSPSTHALVGVRIVMAPGEVIESGTLVIRDGIIEAVGQDLSPPADARIHEFEREEDQEPITIYPGLIDPYLALDAAPAEDESDAQTDTPQGRHPLIRPDRQLAASEWPGDRLPALREAGFTTALLAPTGGLLSGTGSVVNLGDGELSHNLLVPEFAQFASFSERLRGREFPSSLMGSVALLRQTLDDASWQVQARAAWQRNPAQARPAWLEGLDALAPALDGSTPMVFIASDMADSLRILEFTADRSLDLVMVGHGHEYQRPAGLVRRAVPHILPLNFPEPPEARDADDRDVSLEALRHWQAAPSNPARLAEAGVALMVTSQGLSQPKQIHARLATAIEAGLSSDQALAAVTVEPARWLGLADRAGQIRPGFMANFIVVEGELFTDGPAINAVWIDGQQHILAAFEPPTVDPAGRWTLTLGLGSMGNVDAEMVLSGPPTGLSGSITIMGSESPFSDVRVSGEEVVASMDASRFGGSGTVSLRMTIDGDRASGRGNGPYGEFTVRGQRTATPDGEIL